MNKKGNAFRCAKCGQFIGYYEFQNNNISIEHIPETDFSVEMLIFKHKRCKTESKALYQTENTTQ